VDVAIEDVTDLGSFQFGLTYDSAVVSVTHVALGPFLGSTGRGITETNPTYGVESVTYGADSWGENPGPDGDGVLATITFDAVGPGSSLLRLDETVPVTDTAGAAIDVGTQDGNVTVTTGCREDVNGDGVINIVDIQLVASRWNDPDRYNPRYDIDDNGRINIVDIQRVAAKWNTTC